MEFVSNLFRRNSTSSRRASAASTTSTSPPSSSPEHAPNAVPLQLPEAKTSTKLKTHDSAVLDLAFLIDSTSSMGSYIAQAQASIRDIIERIVASEKSEVRFALVAYRDHPPQDSTWVTKVFPFTSSVSRMRSNLDKLAAHGGGDGPEAVADGMHEVLKLDFRPEATKICIFIADAPPHGLGENGDGFPDGCPLGLDPIDISHKLAAQAITVYTVGCEPALSYYSHARHFMQAVAQITGGQYVPLNSSGVLVDVIVGGASEEMNLERLMAQIQADAQEEMRAQPQASEEEIATRIQSKWSALGTRTKQLHGGGAKLSNKLSSRASAICHNRNLKAALSEMSAISDDDDCGSDMPVPWESYSAVEDVVTTEQVSRLMKKSKARGLL